MSRRRDQACFLRRVARTGRASASSQTTTSSPTASPRILTPSRSEDMALNILANSGAARTGRSLDAVRAAMLAGQADASSVLKTRPDALTERVRWNRAAAQLVGRKSEWTAPSAALASDDIGCSSDPLRFGTEREGRTRRVRGLRQPASPRAQRGDTPPPGLHALDRRTVGVVERPDGLVARGEGDSPKVAARSNLLEERFCTPSGVPMFPSLQRESRHRRRTPGHRRAASTARI
jgi:hypothetical protein